MKSTIIERDFMKLSILILTHKRPSLFKRCLESALHNIPENVEILVNNDSNDIVEIKRNNIKYYYLKSENLSDIYKMLLVESKGEYIYYLEDDDYLVKDFYSIIMKYLKYDLIGANYYPTWNSSWILKCSTSMNKEFNINREVFQLGQFIFKRSKILEVHFPDSSHIHNDYLLVSRILETNPEVINIPKVIYYQTTDGNDNISFPESTNYYGI